MMWIFKNLSFFRILWMDSYWHAAEGLDHMKFFFCFFLPTMHFFGVAHFTPAFLFASPFPGSGIYSCLNRIHACVFRHASSENNARIWSRFYTVIKHPLDQSKRTFYTFICHTVLENHRIGPMYIYHTSLVLHSMILILSPAMLFASIHLASACVLFDSVDAESKIHTFVVLSLLFFLFFSIRNSRVLDETAWINVPYGALCRWQRKVEKKIASELEKCFGKAFVRWRKTKKFPNGLWINFDPNIVEKLKTDFFSCFGLKTIRREKNEYFPDCAGWGSSITPETTFRD